MIGLKILCKIRPNKNHARLSGFKKSGLNIEIIISISAISSNHDLTGFSFISGQRPIMRNAIEIIIPNALLDPISNFSGLRTGS